MQDYEFKDILNDLISDKKLSKSEIARQLGMSYKRLDNYTKGKFNPNLEGAIILANYFKCSLDFLLALSDKNNYNKEIKFKPNFDKRYEKLRKSIDCSHYKLCEILDMDINTKRDWEKGKIPVLSSLIKLAKYFDVSLDYMVTGEE